MGAGSWSNLWTIKIVLRSFELVSSLKINFVKSKLYGINVDHSLLSAGSSFLSCRADSIPFKFLGIPVGANPRRQATWKPIVETMQGRLSSWTSRHLSYGGRITLINLVLSSLPLYFFSFFKAPKSIIQQLARIQRNFLWGGVLNGKKICWVSWDHICLPRDKGGLGVKNLELFNIALLSKWKWQLLTDGEAIWSDLLRFRYGHLPSAVLGDAPMLRGSNASIWWKDIIGKDRGTEVNWFGQNIGCCMGNGEDIEFWTFKWHGPQPFKALFPSLYDKEVHKHVMVADRFDTNAMASWVWNWNIPLSDAEEQHLNTLKDLLVGISLQHGSSDRWRWIPDRIGIFSVKSCYSLLLDQRQIEGVEPDRLEAIKKLWKNDVPSKVLIFAWRLLLDRLPTRSALHRRGILLNQNDLHCVFCTHLSEEVSHLFFHCPFSKGVWDSVSNWIGKSVSSNLAGYDHFTRFGQLFRHQKKGRINHLIWLATTWCIWNLRNQVVFNGATPDASTLFEDIKFYSWLWFSRHFTRNSCIIFSIWCQDHMSSILSS
jgi:hypothetical protein